MHEFNIDTINDIFSQIEYMEDSNSLFDYLVSKRIGVINLFISLFHEEYSHVGKREGKGEKILMYYSPWKLTE